MGYRKIKIGDVLMLHGSHECCNFCIDVARFQLDIAMCRYCNVLILQYFNVAAGFFFTVSTITPPSEHKRLDRTFGR